MHLRRRLSKVFFVLVCVGIGPVSVAADNSTQLGEPLGNSGIERGRYLVRIAACNYCHTPNFITHGRTMAEKDLLTGGNTGWRSPSGTVYPANLRLYFQDISVEQWIASAREVRQQGATFDYSMYAMTTPDLKAIYEYIRHLGPAGVPAPGFISPDRNPPQPYVLLPTAEQR